MPSAPKETLSARAILEEIRPLGRDSYKRTMMNHGAKEPVIGVTIEELKKIQKRVKVNHQLALDLYETGVYDLMYLAGLVADDAKMTRKELQRWVEKAYCKGIAEYTVPWVAAGSPSGWDLALEWIESPKEGIASAGWQTIAGIASMREDSELDLPALKKLIARVGKTIHKQPNRVRYVMNGFLISVGAAVKPLTDLAIQTAEAMGPVEVDMGETSCKVPSVPQYIDKIRKRGALGKKRKTIKC